MTVVPNGRRNATAKKENIRVVEQQVRRSCESGTRDCTHPRTTPASVPSSSVSPGVNSEIFPEDQNVACWNVCKSVAHPGCSAVGKPPIIKYDDDSSSGLGWAMLRNQRGLNGRGPKTVIAVNRPLMIFTRATKMAERWAMVLIGTSYGDPLLVRDVERERDARSEWWTAEGSELGDEQLEDKEQEPNQ